MMSWLVSYTVFPDYLGWAIGWLARASCWIITEQGGHASPGSRRAGLTNLCGLR